MIRHLVEITNGKSGSMRILISLRDDGQGSWQALDQGYFCFDRGVADVGYYPISPLGWVSLYGGHRVDDSKLVLHLDDFKTPTSVGQGGSGVVYPKDYLLMPRGEISWRLVS